MEISKRQKRIIEIIRDNASITQEEMASILNISRFTIIREIKVLEEKGIIKRIGSNKTGNWKID